MQERAVAILFYTRSTEYWNISWTGVEEICNESVHVNKFTAQKGKIQKTVIGFACSLRFYRSVHRSYEGFDEMQPTEQAGFRKNFSTTVNSFTLNQLLNDKKRHRWQKLSLISFLSIWKRIRQRWTNCCVTNPSRNFVWIVKKANRYYSFVTTLSSNEVCISFEKILWSFDPNDPLSPNLVMVYLKMIFHKFN